MNKYLVSSIIVLGIFLIFTLVIHNNVVEFHVNPSEDGIFYEFDNGVLPGSSHYFFSSAGTEFMNILSDFGREYFWIVIPILLFIFGGINRRIVAIVIFIFCTCYSLHYIDKGPG